MSADQPRFSPATDATFETIADELAASDLIDLIDQGWSEEDAEAIMLVMRDIWKASWDQALAEFHRRLVN